MSDSIQHKISRVRPPRVQITYDVEIGNAIQMKELPFVMGIISDLSGKPSEPLPKMKERKFVEIDRDNFNDILASIKPLRKLYEARQRLSDLLTKLDGNDDLEALLREMVGNADKQKEVKKLLEDSKGK